MFRFLTRPFVRLSHSPSVQGRHSVRHSRLWLLVASFAVLAPLGAAGAPPAMTTPGQFSVSATGAATYAMPIIVPPGTAGMAPTLSLNYSSQSGNGILGFGWSLGGLPSIARCPQTVAQDGTHGSVNYATSDRFCLDGQRLLLVNGGSGGHSYGDDGSEYRTEIETFSRIVAHGTQGNGPSYFTVYTKAGQILELGNPAGSSNAQILAQGKTTVRVWAVDKVSDTSGNYMTVFYHVDTAIGQYYPDHILYSYGTGVSAYNSVYFRYQARTDYAPLYHAGSLMEVTQLLSNIQTYLNTTGTGTPVTDYKLTYQLGNAPYSQLISVQRCDGGDVNCLAKTSFGWQTATQWNSRIVLDSKPTLPGTASPGTFLQADFNGDGILDGYGVGDLNHPCATFLYEAPLSLGTLSSGMVPANMTETYSSGTSATACLTHGNPFFPDGVVGDLDGDGFTDMYNTTALFKNNTDGTFSQIGMYGFGSGSNPAQPPQDYNGDGRNAENYGYSNTTHVLSFSYSNGDGTWSSNAYTIGGDSTTITRAAGDVDGDGCADVLVQNVVNEVFSSCNPTHPLPIADYGMTGAPGQYSQGMWGDFNGDGLADYVFVPCPNNPNHASLNISTGASFVVSTASGLQCGQYNTNQFFVGDFDGDGKSDLIMVDRNGMYVYTWNGAGGLSQVYTEAIHLPQPDCNWNCVDGNYDGTLQVTDVDGDGCSDLLVYQGSTPWYYKFGCHPPLLMTSISNGLGATTTITYDRLNQNQPLYTKCPANPTSYACGDTYPTQAVDGPIYVVKEVDSSNGLGTCNAYPGNLANCFTSTYTYGGAKTDLSGRGFQGFQQVIATDAQTHVVTTTAYNTQFPFTGTVKEQARAVGSLVLSDVTNTYKSFPATPVIGTPTFVYLDTTHATGSEVDGTALPTTNTYYKYDDGTIGYDTTYGNLLHMKVAVSGGSYKITDNTYCNLDSACDDDPVNKWIIGRLTSTTVTSHVTSSTITRTSSFGYLPSTGVLNQEVIEPTATTCNSSAAPTACMLETDYTIDAFGHRTIATVSGIGFTSRTNHAYYDAKGEFETSASNAKTQAETWTYSDATDNYPQAFGVPATHTDINNQTTTWTYDSFGRMRLETHPGSIGTKVDVQYFFCTNINGGSTPCPTGGAFMVQVTPERYDGSTNGPVTLTYYDDLARVIRVDTQGYQNGLQTCGTPCWIRKDVVYDAYGQVSKTTRPYFVTGGTAKWITADYTVIATGYPSGYQDPYGRPWKTTYPGTTNTIETYAYTGLGSGTQVTFVDRLGNATVTSKNAQGLVSSVVNALSKTTSYVYDAYGDLKQVTDAAGNHVTSTYDIRGNKLTSTDPDMGAWKYTYDALGELLTQIDAKGQSNSLTYDALGRVLTRTEPDQINTWTYDTAANGVGKLSQETAQVPGGSVYYTRTQSYISTGGLPLSTVININGTNYTYTYGWHSNDRIATIQFPSGYTEYEADTYRDLAGINDWVNGNTGTLRWTDNTRDAERRITDETAANGVETVRNFDPDGDWIQQIRALKGATTLRQFDYKFDAVGNLTSRTDNLGAFTENFCYDDVNRLQYYAVGASGSTNCQVAKSGFTARSMTYDDNTGNIANKSDLASNGTGTYTYPAPGAARPHAVTSISGTVTGVNNPKFTYDLNGNMTCEYTGSSCSGSAVQTQTWTSFNMVQQITEGPASSTFTYDSEHSRIVQHTVVNGSTTTDTTYLNDPVTGAQSEMVVSGGTTTWHDYIKADGKLVAERTCTGAAPCSSGETWTYLMRDHLDSISVITDANGAVLSTGGQLSFDAWGRQRNTDGHDDTSCTNPASEPTTRGFTSQEEMPSYCLVNLNARLYDPTLARMMSPDFVVPEPYDGESYNRYSYVNNRPTSFNDPTGNDGCQQNSTQQCSHPWTGNGGPYTDPGAHPEMEAWNFGDPGKKSATPRGNVQLATNSDGETAQAIDKSGNGSSGIDSPVTSGTSGTTSRVPYTCDGRGWCHGSDGTWWYSNAEGNRPEPQPITKPTSGGMEPQRISLLTAISPDVLFTRDPGGQMDIGLVPPRGSMVLQIALPKGSFPGLSMIVKNQGGFIDQWEKAVNQTGDSGGPVVPLIQLQLQLDVNVANGKIDENFTYTNADMGPGSASSVPIGQDLVGPGKATLSIKNTGYSPALVGFEATP
jgi:RHS repeat-associated protein